MDGAHIRTCFTFFCRHMPQLVRAGYLYIAQAPLYRIIRRKKEEYVQDDVALNRKLIELAVNDVTLRVSRTVPVPSHPDEFSAILGNAGQPPALHGIHERRAAPWKTCSATGKGQTGP